MVQKRGYIWYNGITILYLLRTYDILYIILYLYNIAGEYCEQPPGFFVEQFFREKNKKKKIL